MQEFLDILMFIGFIGGIALILVVLAIVFPNSGGGPSSGNYPEALKYYENQRLDEEARQRWFN